MIYNINIIKLHRLDWHWMQPFILANSASTLTLEDVCYTVLCKIFINNFSRSNLYEEEKLLPRDVCSVRKHDLLCPRVLKHELLFIR